VILKGRDISDEFILAAAMFAVMAFAAALAFHYKPSSTQGPKGEMKVTGVEAAGETPESFCKDAGEILIEVNIPATELTLYEDGIPKFRRRVAIGQGVYPTPEQATAIKGAEWNPWWYPPDAPWAKGEKPTPPGPGNPMGLAKMALSREILFHGTNKPWSVGRPASHGCMRMHNRDVTDMAWYLQQRFSSQCDPALREQYEKQGWKTFTVKFDRPVPVHVVYRPVLAREGKLAFFKDHYNRVAGKREAAILTELIRAGYDIEGLDEDEVKALSERWPLEELVDIRTLMREKSIVDFIDVPECS